MSITIPTNTYYNNSRSPQAIVMVNDIQVLWADISIITSTFYIADTYQVELPLNSQTNQILNLDYWGATPNFTVKIYIGFPDNPAAFTIQDLDLMIVGDVTETEVDPLSGRVTLHGRDLTGKFIDAKNTFKFSNQTSSQIAIQLANQQGLTPQVTPTTTPVGNFFQSQQTLLTYQYTQWDLLCFLAQQEDYVCFVSGNYLVFEPRPTSNNNQTNGPIPFVLNYQLPAFSSASPIFNGMSLVLTRCNTLASNVKVTVRVPYNPATGQAFHQTASSSHRQRNNGPSPSAIIQRYVYVIPGLSPQQAKQKAQQLLHDLTIHEVRIHASLPGNNIIKKDTLIQLQGTGTAYDQIYYPDEIIRTINIEEGYRMEISAKNSSIDQQLDAA